jgi:hypothetical protein
LAHGGVKTGSKLIYKGTDAKTGESAFTVTDPSGKVSIIRVTEDDADLVLDAINPKNGG